MKLSVGLYSTRFALQMRIAPHNADYGQLSITRSSHLGGYNNDDGTREARYECSRCRDAAGNLYIIDSGEHSVPGPTARSPM